MVQEMKIQPLLMYHHSSFILKHHAHTSSHIVSSGLCIYTVMKLVVHKVRFFLTSLVIISFSRRTVHHGVNGGLIMKAS
jgi:hypothetical protein